MKIFYSIIAIIILLLVLYGLGSIGFFDGLLEKEPQNIPSENQSISSFEECVQAGYPVMESYPMQCITPTGEHFVSPFDNRGPNDDGTFCAQVITQARNPQTGEVKDFPTPCDVPNGWEMMMQ